MLPDTLIEQIRARGAILDSDVAQLRKSIGEADIIAPETADGLFALHTGAPIQDASWNPFFIETITEFVVRQAEPPGYIVSANARWLIDRISIFGRVETSIELALLIHALEVARWAPPSLAAFALNQVRLAVETGTGPLRAGRPYAPKAILPQEIELVARILSAFGADTKLPVTRIEADALFDINRAIDPANSPPSWNALFVRAIGAAVLAATGHATSHRPELIEQATAGVATPELLALIMGGVPSAQKSLDGALAGRRSLGTSVWASAPLQSREARSLQRLERQRLEIVTSEVIEEATDLWLMARLSEPASASGNETALLAHVAREATSLPQSLADFAARRAAA